LINQDHTVLLQVRVRYKCAAYYANYSALLMFLFNIKVDQ